MTEQILKIIKDAGQIILFAHDINHNIESKEGNANFVTKYDKEVQAFLFDKLKEVVPDAVFIGEEDQEQTASLGKKCFIIDPIDGTTNFIFDNKHSAISIAYLENGIVVFGAVYDPYQDEIFYAERGKGAYLRATIPDNGSLVRKDRLLLMNNLKLSEGIACFGTSPYYSELVDQSFVIARKLFDQSLDLRRSGSAALDLSYVAAGRYVFFVELRQCPWDYAAASLIIEEAGGKISTYENDPISFDRPCSVIAGTMEAYKDFYNIS